MSGASRAIALQGDVDPPAGTIDGDEQITPGFPVDGREIFDIDVHEARFIGFERLV